ncbi:hypothetical protein SAMN06295967_11580 [Belliella buryatensis]|uniref:ABC-2 type transport system permease protein n=1 Tax=Belliella buryatensis TaxID=1500549 RepID=A0A239GB60_9BACT|nr:DUF5687 family protein [Belliella buryatensis]SNS66407.1 hypothetical protein SAMN06295967_11580 [Belliella buryatensis]
MMLQLIKLELLKTMRSTSFAKSVLVAIFLGFLAIVLLSYLLILGIFLKEVIEKGFNQPDAYAILSANLIYFFLVEFMYRYFTQQLPVIELERFLHLPIKKSKIINFLLARSFISPLTLVAFLLFAPFAFKEVMPRFGDAAGWSWLLCILLTSWSLHWLMLWFKQKFEDSFTGLAVIFAVLLLGAGSNYYGWFNIGELMKPVFDWSLTSPFPVLVMAVLCLFLYRVAYSYYFENAYLESLAKEEDVKFANTNFGIFDRFGLAGELANLEWKLIIRHKKSRTYLMLAGFFLLYGLIFYTNPVYQSEDGFSHIFIFVGTFITSIFMLQYGQLFLSWNSANFDFFLQKRGGIEALVKGKYLLFVATSALCFLASVPYVYFGWDILLIHVCTFLFNMGVVIHLVIYFSLWKPKPMDLNKGAMFNYEGVGIAQFLMMLPIFLGPYAVYFPFALLINQYAGLAALAISGLVGIVFSPYLSSLPVNKILKNRYEISSAFRQEL